MANVYSQVLAAVKDQSGDSAPYIPPSGYLWVIRDITLFSPFRVAVTQFSITGLYEIVMYSGSAESTGGTWLHEEVRQVVPQGAFFQLHATFPVDWYISGYALSLP